MQPNVTSGTDEKSIEQASVTTPKGRGKKRNAELAGVADTSTPKAAQADPTQATPAPSLVHRSPRSSRDVSPYPRTRPSTPNRSSPPNISSRTASSSSLSAIAPVAPPAPRRSQRTLAKGPERPRGPPELEVALSIAIRNLESDVYTWWCANYKPGNPIPTTAFLKGRSPRIRKAAEAVDEADRLLNEAVYGKPKKLRTSRKSQVLPQETSGDTTPATPEPPLERLEINSKGKSPLKSVAMTSSGVSVEANIGV